MTSFNDLSLSKEGTGEDALAFFMQSANSFFQDDATGDAYAIKHGALGLEMVVLSQDDLYNILTAAQNDPTQLSKYSMILIDSGNVHGDSWKAIYHPAQEVFHFVREDYDPDPRLRRGGMAGPGARHP